MQVLPGTIFKKKDGPGLIALCNECKEEGVYSGNTSNLVSHLRTSHKAVYAVVIAALADKASKQPRKKISTLKKQQQGRLLDVDVEEDSRDSVLSEASSLGMLYN